jgi:2-oxoglutarate ferredoxin oxidoreductase subunit beta
VTHRGFAVVDILTSCPTYFGRMNDVAEPYDMVHYLRDTSSPLQDCTCGHSDGPDTALLPTGIFRDEERADYESLYRRKVAAATAKRSSP